MGKTTITYSITGKNRRACEKKAEEVWQEFSPGSTLPDHGVAYIADQTNATWIARIYVTVNTDA